MSPVQISAELWETLSLATALGVLLLLFAWSSRSLLRLPSSISRSSDELAAAIRSLIRGEANELPRPLGDLAESAASAIRTRVTGQRGDRVVVSAPLRTLLADWVDELKRSKAAVVWGSSYTGIALVFTFGLIAWVLFGDVRQAILPGPDGQLQSQRLSDAVGKMGFKFIISCAGILLAIGHAFVMRAAEGQLDRAVSKLEAVLAPTFVDQQAVQLELADEQVRWLAAIRGAVDESRADTGRRLERLQAIEVSVKDLGAEVTASLNAMVQEAMTDHVRRLLDDIRDTSDRMAKHIEESLKGNLAALGGQLVAALESMEQMLKSQSNAGLDQVLQRLRDVLTGGFASETQNMAGLLTDFQRVIPELATQLQSVASNLGEVMAGMDAQQREQRTLVESLASSTTENVQRLSTDFARGGAEAMQHILQQTNARIDGMVSALDEAGRSVAANLGQVMAGMEAQQREQRALVASLASTTTDNVQRLSADFARGGAEAMGHILQETNARIDRMVTGLDEAGRSNIGRSSAITTDFERMAARVTAVTKELSGSTEHVRTLMQHVEAALVASQKGIGQLSDAAKGLKGASDGMLQTVDASDRARRRMEELLEKQAKFAESNEESLAAMQRIWPQLLQQVATTIKTTTSSLVSSWESLSNKLSDATAQYGQDVGAKVEDLSDAVNMLHETMKKNGARN